MPDIQNVDLFGRDIIDPFRSEQLPLFHEPVQIARSTGRDAIDERIARKFANTPTGELFNAAKPTHNKP